jgi:hypothetical protein
MGQVNEIYGAAKTSRGWLLKNPDNAGIERAMLNTDPHGFLYRTVAFDAGFAIIGFGERV